MRVYILCVQAQGTQVEEMKSEMYVSDKWTRLVVVQETCAQLQSLTGEGFDGRKELIDPDGQSTGHNPIEVSSYIFYNCTEISRQN